MHCFCARASLSFIIFLLLCLVSFHVHRLFHHTKIDIAQKYFATSEHLSWQDENFDRFILAAKVKAATT